MIFPSDERYALSDQLKRSANAIIANIAESHGRYAYKDKVRVLYIARGEIVETRSHLAVAYGRDYIKQSTFTDLNRRYTMLTQSLNLYIKNLQSK
ncbi:MAG TPA: four helix bundle protein [Candidatus Magasanikbacteria bacterium]|nr:four helix bundle protein [Candidatus Magasanikbacteria bacterium]HCC13611.1 four helix bundle protein [Candidatus Magasanikbacteria bacterium]HCM53725.1 four helix bundle protein [Candidatus Magasanikbacteria bacterium]